MNIEFTLDEAWQIYERIKGDLLYYEKIFAIIPGDGKVMVQQQINDLKPIASKLETAFPRLLEDMAQNELGRRTEERMKQEGFR